MNSGRALTRRATRLLGLSDLVRVTPLSAAALTNWLILAPISGGVSKDEGAASDVDTPQYLRMGRSGLQRAMMLRLTGPQAGPEAKETAQLLETKPLGNPRSI